MLALSTDPPRQATLVLLAGPVHRPLEVTALTPPVPRSHKGSPANCPLLHNCLHAGQILDKVEWAAYIGLSYGHTLLGLESIEFGLECVTFLDMAEADVWETEIASYRIGLSHPWNLFILLLFSMEPESALAFNYHLIIGSDMIKSTSYIKLNNTSGHVINSVAYWLNHAFLIH